MKIKILLLLGFASLTMGLRAQTTLSGDHIVTGDLSVGTSGTKGGITITGETGNTAAPGLRITGDGGVVFTGSLGVGTIPDETAMTKFMWFPKKAALRAGTFNDGDQAQYEYGIGENSFAFGYNAIAGDGSFAGSRSMAQSVSISLGDSAYAGSHSLALGVGANADHGSIAFNPSSFAIASSFALGSGAIAQTHSFAMGENSVADMGSFAFGDGANAIGERSVAFGFASAIGNGSTAVNGAISFGDDSVAFGRMSTSYSNSEFVIGRNNLEEGDSQAWVETDPLFVVGNGTGDSEDPPEVQNRNAFVIYKNGDVKISKPQGDISMGEFGE